MEFCVSYFYSEHKWEPNSTQLNPVGNDFKREISLDFINIETRKFSASRNLAELNIK